MVIGLGATDSKIILTGTAFGNVFTLMDAEHNMPGSSVSDVVPLPVTYQQVCKAIKNGNWTLEREEDMTGPYTYNGRVWIAFDDDISLKIKVSKFIIFQQALALSTRYTQSFPNSYNNNHYCSLLPTVRLSIVYLALVRRNFSILF